MSLADSDLNQRPRLHPSPSGCVTPTWDDKAVMLPDKPKIAELRNGKIIFRQKPMSFDNHSETMQEIVTFRGILEASETPLAIIPDEHLPLIAKLVHESDKTLAALTKSIQSSLVSPILESSQHPETVENSNFLLPSAVEDAIKIVADRANYGIATDTDKPPAALSVWRWEIKNTDWLPKSATEKVAARLKERVAANKYLRTIFEDLPADDREAILKNAKQSKAIKGKQTGVEPRAEEKEVSQSSISHTREEDSESSAKKPGRSKKALDPESIVKDKEKHKHAIKAEKEKKAAEATKRSAAVFANFFKPAANSSRSSKAHDPITAPASSPSTSTTSANVNEFQTTFRPFVLKKDSQLAPVNWFLDKRKQKLRDYPGRKGNDNLNMVIELDAEGREVQGEQGGKDQYISLDVVAPEDVSALTPNELLRSFLNLEHPSLPPAHRGLSKKSLKSGPTHCVREIMNRLIEAEVQGDQRAVHRLMGLLKNRRKIPVKVLVFAENNRPGYLGTWTRSSSTIGPRTPFARDLLSFDYDHDTDAEWEEEADSEVEEIDSQDESMEDDVSSVGSEMDGWLVEGDEIDVEPTTSVQEPSLPRHNANKRKVADSRKPPSKKRKVVPLIPFQKGPIWEQEIGRCDYEPFRPMCIQLFNDIPFPIDPFTSVCEPALVDKKKETEAVFVVPALPEHVLATHLAAVGPSTEDTRAAKRRAANLQPPKTTFPDAHISLLLQKIDGSNTNSFLVLLDLLFQDFKSLGVKKNALEVKLREVAEKDKINKSWVVKEDAWTGHGLVKPS